MRKRKYTVEDHLQNASLSVITWFNVLNVYILELPSVEKTVTNPYIGYKFKGHKRARLFVEIHIQIERIQLHLRPVDYTDPDKRVTQVADSHKWTLNRILYISNEAELNYAMGIIKQSYRNVS